MCDYSLEMYGSRPAREGELYVTTRFPSGSIGFAAPGDPRIPVCVQCDTRVVLTDIPFTMQATYGMFGDLCGLRILQSKRMATLRCPL